MLRKFASIATVSKRIVSSVAKSRQLLDMLFDAKGGMVNLESLEASGSHEFASLFSEYREQKELMADLEELAKNDQLKASACEDIALCRAAQNHIVEKMMNAVVPFPREDFGNAILEVSSGVGGQEANLFAMELWWQYRKFASYNSWVFEVCEIHEDTLGGLRSATAIIKGKKAYGVLKFESGIHRVQRVPVTEKGGRMHTSTASVFITPEYDDIEVDLDPADLKIEVTRSSGAGGQNKDTTNTAVRITHLPSKTAVRAEEERQQTKNLQSAMKKLKRLLYLRKFESELEKTQAQRKVQIGTRERSMKIRTYNYSQDRVTDHRLKEYFSVAEFLSGQQEFAAALSQLADAHKREVFEEAVTAMVQKCSVGSTSA